MSPRPPNPAAKPPPRQKASFSEDFRRFFLRGLAALLPTLITLWLLVWAWNFLWQYLGRHIIWGIRRTWLSLAETGVLPYEPAGYIGRYWADELLRTRIVGVLLAIILVYVVGVFVGNFIGRAFWRLAELALMKVPLVRAIYPAVKQVTDFLLSDRTAQFSGSRVVACRPHESGIWSIGLITGKGPSNLAERVGEDLVTVFVPSTPTAFSGYMMIVPRSELVELPLTVEEAMRLLISGGVVNVETKVPPAGLKQVFIGARAAGAGEPTEEPAGDPGAAPVLPPVRRPAPQEQPEAQGR